MKPVSLLICLLSVSAATGFLGAIATRTGDEARGVAGAEEATLEDLEGLTARLGLLQRNVSGLRGQLEMAKSRADEPEVTLEEKTLAPDAAEIEVAVERWVQRRLATVAASNELGLKDSPYQDLSGEEFLRLFDGSSFSERQLLWQAAREAGKEAELLEGLKSRAEANPEDANIAYDLAGGYMQMRYTESDIVKAMEWSELADATYDRTLELNPDHWDARMGKAAGLALWPAMRGKTGEAISHLEKLTRMQAPVGREGSKATAYLYLGNLRLRSGDRAGALAALREGSGLFPSDDRLRAQLSLLE